jgi:hypothetical protein
MRIIIEVDPAGSAIPSVVVRQGMNAGAAPRGAGPARGATARRTDGGVAHKASARDGGGSPHVKGGGVAAHKG